MKASLKRNRERPDGPGKVTGQMKYLSDLAFPGMLYGKIKRSDYPHARIISIDTKRAEQVPGVAAVITHKDVPGLNAFGIVIPDQPVLCEDYVRYTGDAVAAVAAESLAAAEQALDFIDIEYEPLLVVSDPVRSLDEETPNLHPAGNLLHEKTYIKGDVNAAFLSCSAVAEETYELPRQMHTYMETEGGVIIPEEDGGVTVYVGTQHGFQDRFQLSRILNMPEEDIRIVSSPMGGSFGGKDELNIQPYGALLALAAGRPVKIHQTRQESVLSGLKRHPMKITMKTGAGSNGQLLAHQVYILADTGAYSTLGPAILDFAVEHATGPYVIPNVHTEGQSVFTNNGVAGEFRGFGGNQVTFALEGQMDRLAEKLMIDPLELRRRNVRKKDSLGPLGQRIAPVTGASDVLESIAKHQEQTKDLLKDYTDKRKIRGIGSAITMHGGGLGYGRLDPAGGRLRLTEEGKIEAAFGFEEAGQGILGVIETIVTEELGCAAADLSIVIGDTALVPSSGSTTASRGTSMVWQALENMKRAFGSKLIAEAAEVTGVQVDILTLGRGGVFANTRENMNLPVITYSELASQSLDLEKLTVSTEFDFPTTPDEVDAGHFLYTFAGVLAQVEIDLLTGKVKVIDLDQAIAAGPVVNFLGYKGQIEGGGVMGLGYALMEEAIMTEGEYVTKNLDDYLIPGIGDVPFQMKVDAVETLEEGDSYGPRGVGEIGSVAVAPAIAKAVHDALGCWVNKLPVSAEETLLAVNQRRRHQWMKVEK
ncbi:xanthine dehydrogenase subunit D [Halobacillus sp. A5]|uniref:xanthine dehydrogenase subunit D n=1 Tax=Halobacillus sp. A5 TaxID=2880263 RepID=UPI0020A6B4AC|nr:xanthine dehydrogenase subunit D [Halobacillus sp. A5]MCP3028432.1 xanthine dehydrogenase subunit D [Halobacillus sp. A5]